MLVVGLKQTSSERYRVCFEDGTEIKSTLSAVAEMRVSVGRELDEEALERFRVLSERSLTLERSIELLSLRQMSAKELSDKLIRKGIDRETAEYCCGKLKTMGLLDEAHYASALARHYSSRGYGAGRVRAELSRRGIDRDLWEDALNSMPEDHSRLDKIVRTKLTDPSDREQIRKVTAALSRRGYSWGEIRSALERVSEEIEITEPEEP